MTYIVFLAALLITDFGPSDADDRLMICQCTIVSNSTQDEIHKEKEVYTFVVRGSEGSDCCEHSPVRQYPGFREHWVNESPEYPDVWRMSNQGRSELDGKNAQNIGCSAEEQVLSFIPPEQFDSPANQYYPEMIKKSTE